MHYPESPKVNAKQRDFSFEFGTLITSSDMRGVKHSSAYKDSENNYLSTSSLI